MSIGWYDQSAFRLTVPEATVFISPFADVAGLAESGSSSTRTDRQRQCELDPGHPRARRSQRRRGDRRIAVGASFHAGSAVPDRRRARGGLPARHRGRHRARQHDLHLRARRNADRALRRLRPELAMRRSRRRDRSDRSAVHSRRCRADDQPRASRRDRRPAPPPGGSSRSTTARRGSVSLTPSTCP